MTIAMLALAAACIGAILGLRCKVFVLIPVVVISFVTVLGVGLAFGDSAWFALLVAYLAIAVLQTGYLAGGAIGYFIENKRARKNVSGLIAVAQRIPRDSAQV